MTRTSKPRVGVPDFPAAPGGTVALAADADVWVPVGPAVTLRGAARTRPRISGRFTALAVHQAGQRVYAGSALGGLWYSDDGGSRWTSLDFYASTRNAAGGARVFADANVVGALLVEWGATAADDVVYVGAGENPATGVERTLNLARGVGIRRAVNPVGKTRGVVPAPVPAVAIGPAADPWELEAPELAGVVVNRLDRDNRAAGGDVWAATSLGLYQRATVTAVTAWRVVNTGLGNGEIADVVVMPGVGAEARRIYVATIDGRVARSVDGVAWVPVALPAIAAVAPAPALPPISRMRLAAANVAGHAVVYALADGPRLWRIDGDVASPVRGLPAELFKDRAVDESQSSGMALAVHPNTDGLHPDLIAVGGQIARFPADQTQAALFKGTVTLNGGTWQFAHAAAVGDVPPEWVGDKVPPGIRALVWVPGPAVATHVWVAGDGGLFRSDADGNVRTFKPRNSGLAAIESTQLAQAPGCEAILLLSTRTSGALLRVSSETWEVSLPGAGGGVAIDGLDSNRMFAQVSKGTWQKSSDGGATWSDLGFMTRAPSGLAAAALTPWTSARKAEIDASAPIGRLALISEAGSPRGTQHALGTDRIWYTDETLRLAARGTPKSGWVTLPSAADPYSGAAPDRAKDRLNDAVLVTRWGTANRLYALTRKGVYSFVRDAAGAWAMTQLYDQDRAHRNWKGKVPAGEINGDLPLTAFAVHDPLAEKGKLYVGTSGAEAESHVWWFNGKDKWIATGLILDSAVYALAVDPQLPDVVYAGTDEGVWRGVINTAAPNGPTWAWTRYSTGLPESPCVDLLIAAPEAGQQRFLRAALAGRGVWEVAVSAHQQAPEVYLRSHRYESRRVGVPPGGPRSPFVDPDIGMYTSAHPQGRLDSSPDVRVLRAATATPPSPVRFPVVPAAMVRRPVSRADVDEFDSWLLQSSLRARGEDIDPNLAWSAASDTALASQKNLLAPAAAATDIAVWNAIVGGNAPAFDNAPPDHADAARHLRDEPDRWPKGAKASCACADSAQVMVTVHSRHWRTVPKDSVKVVLLQVQYATSPGNMFGRRDASNVPSLPAGWDTDLDADQTAPNGNWMGAGGEWSYADAVPFRALPADLDANNPQIVTFNVNFAAADASKWHLRGWLLVAVVLSTDDPLVRNPPLLAQTDIAQLVRNQRLVAARSVRPARQLAEPYTHFAGIDIGLYPTRSVMETAWLKSNIMWTGLYLDSPLLESAPPLNEVQPPNIVVNEGTVAAPVMVSHWVAKGHNRNGLNPAPAAANAWMRAWSDLYPLWGIAPLYWGQQDGRLLIPPPPPVPPDWHPPGPNDQRVDIAVANARDAYDKASARFPPGAVIYLDYETWNALDNTGRDYCTAFFRSLAERGFRPGVYGHSIVTGNLRQSCPGLFVWNARYPLHAPANAWRVTSGQLILDTAHVVQEDANDPDPVLFQWLEGRQLPVLAAANPVVGIAGQPFAPDLDVSVVQNPAFPERWLLADRIRGGKVSVTASAPAACAIYSVRAGRPVVATWSPGASGARTKLVDDQLPHAWNPYSVPSAVRIPAIPLHAPLVTPDSTDLFLALANSTEEGCDIWRLQALRRAPGRQWEHETLADAGFPIDPLPGVVATTRSDQSVEAFVVDDRTGAMAGARWDPEKSAWSTLSALVDGAGQPAAPDVRRTNRAAAVSRGAGIATLFYVGTDGRIRTTSSTAVNPAALLQWTAPPTLIGDPTVRVHPFSNIAVVSRAAGSMDVFFIGHTNPAAPALPRWHLYYISWTAAGGWTAGVDTAQGGDPVAELDPLVPIAACSLDSNSIDVFVAAPNGTLYNRRFMQAPAPTWSLLMAIPTAIAGVRVGSIDGACCPDASRVAVVTTGRDGAVYAAQRAAPAVGFGPLERVATLLLP